MLLEALSRLLEAVPRLLEAVLTDRGTIDCVQVTSLLDTVFRLLESVQATNNLITRRCVHATRGIVQAARGCVQATKEYRLCSDARECIQTSDC